MVNTSSAAPALTRLLQALDSNILHTGSRGHEGLAGYLPIFQPCEYFRSAEDRYIETIFLLGW